MTPSTPAPGPTPRTTAQAANLKIILDRIDDNDFSGIDFIGSLQVLAEEVSRLSTPQGAGAWQRDGFSFFQLMHAGWKKGVEQFKNRVYFSVYFDASVPEHERESIAASLTAHPSPSSPNVGAQPYIHEDELPEDISEELYAAWFARSWVPGGVGCRVGPLLDALSAGNVGGYDEAVADLAKYLPDGWITQDVDGQSHYWRQCPNLEDYAAGDTDWVSAHGFDTELALPRTDYLASLRRILSGRVVNGGEG